jgi:hypothetical protein
MLKKFRLPRLSASDGNREVHLTLADQIEEVVAGDIGIPQGSMIHRNKVYLPDGVPSRDRSLHVKDLKSGKVATFDLNHIAIEPEGVASKGRRLYMSFHTPRSPRPNIIYRFKIERHRD